MRTFLILLLFSSFKHTFAQLAPAKELVNQNWRVVPGYSTKNNMLGGVGSYGPFNLSAGNYQISKLELSPTEQAVVVSYSQKEYGVVHINKDLRVKWNTPVNGFALSLGRLNNHIVVIHTANLKSKFDFLKELQATLIDPSNGKKILTKTIFTEPSGLYIEPKSFFKSTGDGFSLGIRRTNAEVNNKGYARGKAYDKFIHEYSTTSKFELFEFNEKLEETRRATVPVKTDFHFLQAEMNSAGELIFLYSENEKSFGVQRISNNLTDQRNYKSFTIDIQKNAISSTWLYMGDHPEICYVGSTFQNSEKDRVNAVYRFDFANDNTVSTQMQFHKLFRKEMKEKFVQTVKGADELRTDDWTEMEIVRILEYKDFVVCFQEAKQIKQGPVNFNGTNPDPKSITGDAILSIYDRNLKIVDQQVIPKYLELYGTDVAVSSLHCHDNIISLVSGYKTGLMANSTMLIQYDLEKKKIINQTVAERGSAKRAYVVYPAATLWFQNGFVVPYLHDIVGGLYVVNSDFHKFNF